MAAADDPVVDAAQLKVAFVYNFTKYFTWPDEQLWDANDKFVVCLDGDNADHAQFASLEGQLTHERPITLLSTPATVDAIGAQCHLWYISADELESAAPGLAAVADQPVLTVSDAAGSRRAGVVIELVLVDNRMRFQVNLELIGTKKLEASSFLLRLAQP